MSELHRDTDASAGEGGKGALVVGELRYLATTGLVVCIIAGSGDETLVEYVPGNRRVLVRATRDLEQAALVHPDGFRVRWARGDLMLDPGDVGEILQAILLDEERNGRDRIRLRILDEYLGPVPDSDALKERLRLGLTGTDVWMKVGRGSDLGYVPADRAIDWRDRWRRDEVPLPTDRSLPEEEAVATLRERVRHLRSGELGKVVACAWLPAQLRAEAVEVLTGRWHSGDDGATFKAVVDDAMTRVVDRLRRDGLDDRGWRGLLTSKALSSSVRALALKAWKQEGKGATLASLLEGSPAVVNLGVLADLLGFAVSADDRVEILAHLFGLEPPEHDDEQRDALRRIVAWCRGLAADALPMVVAGVRVALSRRAPTLRVEAWARMVDVAATSPSIGDVLKALATVERLEGTSDELGPFSVARATVEKGLTRWVQREVSPDLSLDVDVVELARLPDGHLRLPRLFEAATISRDHARLRTWVTTLAAEVARLGAEVRELRHRADDPANAQRVLGRAAAELTSDERAQLKRSALAEVDALRRRERDQVARMISEAVTAVERLAEAGGPPQLLDLSRRLRELATDFGLTVEGRVGDRVDIDPALHDTPGALGVPGEVRRVGVVGVDGVALVKPAVMPRRKGE